LTDSAQTVTNYERTTFMDREQSKFKAEIVKELTGPIDIVRRDVSALERELRDLRSEFDNMKQEWEKWREAHP
jgi:hypothetical protein